MVTAPWTARAMACSERNVTFRSERLAAALVSAVVLAAILRLPRGEARGLVTLSDTDAHAVYDEVARAEVSARRDAAARFRGSRWSQDDEVHAREARLLRTYAASHGFSLASVLDAEARGMREHWPTGAESPPDAEIIPCRPRLDY